MNAGLYAGLISGTSMDALDCALVEITHGTPRALDFLSLPIPEALKAKLLDLCSGHPAGGLRTLGEADVELARLFARAVSEILNRNKLEAGRIAAIGSHGQTVWHQTARDANGAAPFTLQIGDPNTIAELTGITTVADFRRRDIAAGGEGAPLLPALHRHLFQSRDTDRIVLNLGGISNVTLLPAGGPGETCLGFDVGPANVLMDLWIRRHEDHDYDAGGAWAASGTVHKDLLEHLLDDDYFRAAPPKSTGREYFNAQWLERKLTSSGGQFEPVDVQATLLELTAETVAAAVRSLLEQGEVIVCGGGARNGRVLERLQDKLPDFAIATSSEHGLDSDCVEAVGFAWFASQTLARQAMDFTTITGASHPVVMGGIYYA